ncbi:MAG: phosphoribosylformylglycinamidine synthase subunit PurL [Aigarchaeota archaeon]|nr:phosphoribosylformylglycinamidine synthase subunit PurL [Aigarchaeota archaeon]MDW8092718.1 phosphoribosylformylglycinamidine synthase subunit PurL [Nitrososphaerota archaeon]
MAVTSNSMFNLTPDEVRYARERLGREPTLIEWAMMNALWSEHCSYKSSRHLLKTLPTSGYRVVLGPGYDAGIVDVGEGWVVSVHIESHNHPSAIDPYGGAATGVGGVVRDILTVGTKPIAILNSLRFGDIMKSGHSRWLLKNVVKGISDYGNSIGIPTVAGEVEFDECFERNCLVDVACVGVAHKNSLLIPSAREVGSHILLVGNATGRDGIGGANLASKTLDSSSESERGAVQIPDPYMEKIIIDAIEELVEKGLLLAIKDLGAGGLATAIPELVHKSKMGAILDLSAVHLREGDMSSLEVLISESQERMLLVVSSENLEEVRSILEKYEVPNSLIGKVTPDGRIKVLWRGELIADAPVDVLVEAPPSQKESRRPQRRPDSFTLPRVSNLEDAFVSLLSSPNVCSKRWVYEQYDQEVGARTVVRPGEADAAVMKLPNGKYLALKIDGDPKKCHVDPYMGAMNLLSESLRNLTCVGAEMTAIVDHLQFGDPNDPEVYWSFEEVVKGIRDYCVAAEIPIVGGKVSFYNSDSTTGKAIKPTPVICAVGLISDHRYITRSSFRKVGSPVVAVGITSDEVGGSEYLERVHGITGGAVPKVDVREDVRLSQSVLQAIYSGAVVSAHDCSRGGLGVALAEMCMTNGIGVKVDLSKLPTTGDHRADLRLFSEGRSRVLMEVDKSKLKDCERILRGAGVPYAIIGVTGGRRLEINLKQRELIDLSVSELREFYRDALSLYMG